MVQVVTSTRTSLWTIREWHNSPDLSTIFQEIHDEKLTGRLMLHITQGQIQSVELCTRTEIPGDFAEAPTMLESLSARR